jgi:hypothetical protein
LSGDKLAERERLLLEPYLQMSGLWGWTIVLFRDYIFHLC